MTEARGVRAGQEREKQLHNEWIRWFQSCLRCLRTHRPICPPCTPRAQRARTDSGAPPQQPGSRRGLSGWARRRGGELPPLSTTRWVQQEAKRDGNQGNVRLAADGSMVRVDDESAGGRARKYTWGQSEAEVSVRCDAPPGLRSSEVGRPRALAQRACPPATPASARTDRRCAHALRARGARGVRAQVEFVAGSRALSLRVRGELVLHGPLHRPILADEATWSIEDGGAGGAPRQVPATREANPAPTLLRRGCDTGAQGGGAAG